MDNNIENINKAMSVSITSPELIGIKDILDMLGTISESINILGETINQIINTQKKQEQQIEQILEVFNGKDSQEAKE